MRTIFKTIICLVLCLFTGLSVGAQDKSMKKAAVYIKGDVENGIKKVIGAKLVTAITSSGDYAAVERTADFLAALSKEEDYSTSGEVREDQIAKLGQKFGVKYVVVADVSEVFDELFVASRLINVETALVEKAYDANGSADSMPQLIELSKKVAEGLFRGVSSGRTSSTGGVNGNINGHEYVDLGLPSGLKWATCNVGASTPTQYGNYFAWGDTFTKGEYTESNCRTYNRSFGYIGGNPEYDAATANWGAPWRMPAKHEFEELLNCCSWSFITMGSTNGYKVTGPNGNYIFLPAAGCRYGSFLVNAGFRGDYWSSSPYSSSESAYVLYFNECSRQVYWYGRNLGQSVRPVSE